MTMLIGGIRKAGLIQFGAFGDDPQVPVQFKLELIASYPVVLEQAAVQLAQMIERFEPDRLLCLPDSIPLATLVSRHVNKPLVYSQVGVGGGIELTGAYDIGHPTVLIANVMQPSQNAQRVIDDARRVGLDVRSAVALLHVHDMGLGGQDTCLLSLQDVIESFVAAGELPVGHVRVVETWMKTGA